jgi:hypothetical protein
MNSFIINSGAFNLLITELTGQYYLLRQDQASQDVVKQFLSGEPLEINRLEPGKFSFTDTMEWHNMDDNRQSLSGSQDVSGMMKLFTQKAENFGGIVATRNESNGKVKVFKKQKLPISV